MAAPKGNKYALGNNGGRPRIYQSPEEFEAKVIEFFDNPPMRKIVVGFNMIDVPSLTITNLALHLGFSSRGTLYEYEKRDEYSDIIKRAMLVCESSYEDNLSSGQCAGSIFALKNMGWSDRQEIEHSGGIAGGDPLTEAIAKKVEGGELDIADVIKMANRR